MDIKGRGGGIQEIQKGVAETLAHLPSCPHASFIDTFYFYKNSIQIIQNFKKKKKKRVAAAHP